jgi:hypothetical protein
MDMVACITKRATTRIVTVCGIFRGRQAHSRETYLMSIRKHFPDLMSQCIRRKRLLQEVHILVENAVPND